MEAVKSNTLAGGEGDTKMPKRPILPTVMTTAMGLECKVRDKDAREQCIEQGWNKGKRNETNRRKAGRRTLGKSRRYQGLPGDGRQQARGNPSAGTTRTVSHFYIARATPAVDLSYFTSGSQHCVTRTRSRHRHHHTMDIELLDNWRLVGMCEPVSGWTYVGGNWDS